MATRFGSYGPRHPQLGRAAYAASRRLLRRYYARHGLHQFDDGFARERGRALRARLDAGEPVLLLGLGVAGHNSGASLVRVDPGGRLELLCNDEEERYRAVKHCNEFPVNSLRAMAARLPEFGATPADIHAALTSWDYVELAAGMARLSFEEFPGPLLAKPNPDIHPRHIPMAAGAPRRIAKELGLDEPVALIMMSHHDNHAYFSYAMSPFRDADEPAVVAVVDGAGENSSSSLYLGRGGRLTPLSANTSPLDSLGFLYGVVSATQGGWPPLSSEGRYMGAAAWGDCNRLTNPYYRQLRQILFFGADGELRLNRCLANWQRAGLDRPYRAQLTEFLGEPIAMGDMWNPDAVLSLDDIEHAEIDRARVDKAAALQLVFEDGLFHLIDGAIRRTGASRLVLTGGTALNCVANMRLLDEFDPPWYRRNLGRDAQLELWVPPIPGDAGTPPGAAFAFAMQHGARPGRPMSHAFYCGTSPSEREVDDAVAAGRLFLAGDAAHVVPPTAAKGLNLAAADVSLLAQGIVDCLTGGGNSALDRYSETALRRVWQVQEFSQEMTATFHRRPGEEFGARLQEARLERLCTSGPHMTAFCEVYAGLPFATQPAAVLDRV